MGLVLPENDILADPGRVRLIVYRVQTHQLTVYEDSAEIEFSIKGIADDLKYKGQSVYNWWRLFAINPPACLQRLLIGPGIGILINPAELVLAKSHADPLALELHFAAEGPGFPLYIKNVNVGFGRVNDALNIIAKLTTSPGNT